MLESLLKKWNIKYFNAEEITNHRRWRKSVMPDESIICNIRLTVKLADAIREAYGSPVRVNSGYRCLEYNRLVGSTDTSEHVAFKALDLSPLDGDIKRFAEVVDIVVRSSRIFTDVNIGLGFYDSFCHIDTGATYKTNNRTWDNRS